MYPLPVTLYRLDGRFLGSAFPIAEPPSSHSLRALQTQLKSPREQGVLTRQAANDFNMAPATGQRLPATLCSP